MTYAPVVILKAPILDEAKLGGFVEQCLADRVKLVAILGEGSSRIEDIVDELVVGDGNDDERYLLTSSHDPVEWTLDDVMRVCAAFIETDRDAVEVVTL